jgi:hypothetical protein
MNAFFLLLIIALPVRGAIFTNQSNIGPNELSFDGQKGRRERYDSCH